MELVNQGPSLPPDTLSHGRCSHGVSRVGFNWDGGECEEMREGQGSGTCAQGSGMTDHSIYLSWEEGNEDMRRAKTGENQCLPSPIEKNKRDC